MAHPIDSRHRNSASSTSSSRNSRNCSSASGIEVLRRRCYNTNGWSEWETLSTRDDKDFSFQFPNNTGELTIRKDFLNDERQQIIAQELMQQQKHLHLFRQYSFHSAQEPRVHFLLHSNATINPKMQQLQQQQKKEYKVDDAKTCDAYVDYHDDGAPQPGYRYGNIRMKAHSLQYLPHVEQLAQDLQSVFPTNTPDGEDDDSDCVNRNTGKRTDALTASTSSTAPACLGESWNIGVNPILYRSGKDYMGFHADDDQGEELIVTAVICCASRSLSDGVSFTKSRRCIRFQRKQRLKRNEKRKEVPGLDFELELWLQAGDVYSMDGTMQLHYEHGVPKGRSRETLITDTASATTNGERLAIVFRRGLVKEQNIDTGTPCTSLEPRVVLPLNFGRVANLEEGRAYSRNKLLALDGTRSAQRGVGGNKLEGCNSLIVSGLRPDRLGQHSSLFRFTYAASTKQGATAILLSTLEQRLIRIFRSAVLPNRFRALAKAGTQSKQYRFDGQYFVRDFCYLNTATNRCVPDDFTIHPRAFQQVLCDAATRVASRTLPVNGVFLFLLDRSRDENEIDDRHYIQYCVDLKTMSSEALITKLDLKWTILDRFFSEVLLDEIKNDLKKKHTAAKTLLLLGKGKKSTLDFPFSLEPSNATHSNAARHLISLSQTLGGRNGVFDLSECSDVSKNVEKVDLCNIAYTTLPEFLKPLRKVDPTTATAITKENVTKYQLNQQSSRCWTRLVILQNVKNNTFAVGKKCNVNMTPHMSHHIVKNVCEKINTKISSRKRASNPTKRTSPRFAVAAAKRTSPRLARPLT